MQGLWNNKKIDKNSNQDEPIAAEPDYYEDPVVIEAYYQLEETILVEQILL